MNLSDELQKLRDLHQSGALSNAEYEAAKARLLNPGVPGAPPLLPPAEVYSPPAALVTSTDNKEAETRQWAMILHLSQFAGFVIPMGGLIAPIVIWQIKKKELPGIDVHGCNATNWVITEVIALVVFGLLCLIFIGIPLLFATIVVGLIFPVIAGIKASNGEVWRYPMSFTFFKPAAGAGAELSAPGKPHSW